MLVMSTQGGCAVEGGGVAASPLASLHAGPLAVRDVHDHAILGRENDFGLQIHHVPGVQSELEPLQEYE